METNTITDWDHPYGFFNNKYVVKSEAGEVLKEITGSVGTLLGVWYVDYLNILHKV